MCNCHSQDAGWLPYTDLTWPHKESGLDGEKIIKHDQKHNSKHDLADGFNGFSESLLEEMIQSDYK